MAGRQAGTEEFALAFRGLLTAAGLSPDKVVSQLERVGMSMARSVLYDWRNGAHLPEDAEVMLAVVRVCRAAVKTRGAVLGPGVPGEDEAWERLLAQAKRARDLRAGRVRRAASAASDRAGKPIGQWDPIALGVHKAIGGTVPPYVRRAHDELLRAVLDPVPVGSRLVVLRGGSSTGKSRAAYEAVLDRLPTWRVDYPRTATALAARLDAGIAPRTVLWLDELRHYAEDQGGRAVLARLAEVLWPRPFGCPEIAPSTSDPLAAAVRQWTSRGDSQRRRDSRRRNQSSDGPQVRSAFGDASPLSDGASDARTA